MKITQVDLYEVEIPPIPPVAKYVPKIYDITLCRIRTDEGIEGWGEYLGTRSDHEVTVQSYLDQEVLALDPFVQPDGFACALLDITGQMYGIPVHRFFGPKVRDEVPVSYWSTTMEPHETAAEAEVGARLGFTNHKLKARAEDVVETVRLIKEVAGPDYTVGLDPNMGFKYLHVATRLAEQLEPFGTVANFEDPVLTNNLDWYRLLREKTHIPQALHLGPPNDVLAALKAECIDYLNLGGPAQQVRKSAALAEAADVPCWVQIGGLCLSIMAAYSVHVQCTLPNAILPCDELPHIRIADVVKEGLTIKAGHFLVPEGPGLGIKVDMDVIEKYRVA